MSTPRFLLPVAALLLAVGVVAGSPLSGATFTSSSTTPLDVTAANDWTPPTVTVTSPGVAISGTTSIVATARDARSEIASVTIEFAMVDSENWRTLCADTVAPYSCDWNTTAGGNAVPDGLYELRATAIDAVGLGSVSDVVQTRVVNSAAVILSPLEENLRGSVTLQATFVHGGPVPASLYFEYAVAGGASWLKVPGCGTALLGNARSCIWDTTSLTGEYDVRAVAVAAAPLGTFYDPQFGVVVDNTLPAVNLTVPASPLRGTVALTATASDEDSGMASVRFDYRLTGTSPWLACGTDVDDPWRCALNTAALADGSYEFRAAATDAAGNARTTATQTRTVNNTVSSVSITSPLDDATLRGAVTITADASSTAGVTGVTFEARPAGGTWTTLCTDAAAPFTCGWDSSAITSASYELQAILTDGTGANTTSAVVPVAIDNQVLRGLDVQVANVATSGRPAAGDRITLTYSALVDLVSIKPGWGGSSTSLSVAFQDKGVSGAPLAGYDWANLTGANLGKLSLPQNYVKSKKTATFGATMVAATQTVDDLPVTVVTITLGATAETANLRAANGSGFVRWFPSTLARTPTGQASSAVAAVESGTADRDF